MPLSARENHIRNVRRTGPEVMPCRVSLSMALWDDLRGDLEEVVLRHPILFPSYEKGRIDFDNMRFAPQQTKGRRTRDNMGCVWEVEVSGLMGIVVEHPLDDWSKVKDWQPPASDQGRFDPRDWDAIEQGIREKKARGELTTGGIEHGFFFLRLQDLCAFENVMLAMAEDQPELHQLIDKLNVYNKSVIDTYCSFGVDQISLPEDLGAQTSTVISPAMFRKWCMPSYELLMGPCKEIGAITHVHSDGHTLELMDIFEELGVDIVNPQDLVNGIDNIARECKGRFCIDLDVDRQKVIPFGTPGDVHDLIEEEVRKLGAPEGGLMLTCGIYPPTPPENIDAVCSAMEEFRTYWFDGRGT